MKITSKLGVRYLIKNRRKTLATLLGVCISMALLTFAFIMLSSYQNYAINIMRNERNYEAEFKNIKYSQALEIAENENIKETSIILDLEISTEMLDKEKTSTNDYLNIVAYDENAIKNNHVIVTSGRFATNNQEVVLSKELEKENKEKGFSLGEKINVTINGENKEYTIVGFADGLPYENIGSAFALNYKKKALTYYDSSNIDKNSVCHVSILTKDIKKIYETTDNICEKLNLYKTQEEKQDNLKYNNALLNYALVKDVKNEYNPYTLTEDKMAMAFSGNVRIIALSIIGIVRNCSNYNNLYML